MTNQQLETLYFEMNVNRMLIANLYKQVGVPAELFESHVNKARDYVKSLSESETSSQQFPS